MLPDRLRIAVLDDHPMIGEGLVSALTRLGADLDLIGTATTWAGLIEVLDRHGPPDVGLIDIHINDGTRHEDVIAALTSLGVACLMYTSDARPALVAAGLRAGARGLILKSEPVEVVVGSVEQLRTELLVASSALAFSIVNDAQMVPHLTSRELEALRLLSKGLTQASVARRMIGEDGSPISPGTVRTYIGRVAARYRDAGHATASTMELLQMLRRHGHIAEEPH